MVTFFGLGSNRYDPITSSGWWQWTWVSIVKTDII
jgi:hypothetical protein